MNIDNYRAVKINDGDYCYGIIMLENKYTIKEFQAVINEIKNDFFEKEIFDWTIEDILTDKRLEKFNWFEIPTECYDYVEV